MKDISQMKIEEAGARYPFGRLSPASFCCIALTGKRQRIERRGERRQGLGASQIELKVVLRGTLSRYDMVSFYNIVSKRRDSLRNKRRFFVYMEEKNINAN